MNNIKSFLLRILLVSLAWFWPANHCMAEPMSAFAVKDATALVTDALLKAGAGNEIKARIIGAHDDDVIVTAPQAIEGSVDELNIDKAHNHWQATLLLTSNGHNLAPVKLSGNYDEIAHIPVLKRTLSAGEVINQEDIAWSDEPVTHLRNTTVTNANDLIGKTPRHVISQDRPIRHDEIGGPLVINKGARITLLYHSQNLEIRTLGEAVDNGAKGDVIRVRNLASKSIIEGTVEASDRVRVTSVNSTSAEAM